MLLPKEASPSSIHVWGFPHLYHKQVHSKPGPRSELNENFILIQLMYVYLFFILGSALEAVMLFC